MSDAALNYYILFDNYTQGLALYELLREEGLKARIAPTPHAIQGELACGMSLLVTEESIAAVRACIERRHAEYHSIAAMPCQIAPNRGKFC